MNIIRNLAVLKLCEIVTDGDFVCLFGGGKTSSSQEHCTTYDEICAVGKNAMSKSDESHELWNFKAIRCYFR